MASNKINCLVLVLAGLLVAARPVTGQGPIGTRAAGMAGAFVGVADDATATYWNPAGLASGDFVSGVVDLGGWRTGSPDGASGVAGGRQASAIAAFSVPPLGVTYYRLRQYAATPREAAVQGPLDREEGRRRLQALATDTAGVTLVQSVGEHLAVGATLKLMRGSAARGDSAEGRVSEALDAASALGRSGHTTGDVDLGAMVTVGRMRLGLSARNLTSPTFSGRSAGDAPVELGRAVRVGAGWGSGWPGISRVVVAVDSDLTSRPAPSGDRRDVAAGVETWWRGQRVGVRGGLRASTVGAARTVAASGLSVRLKGLLFLDVQAAGGQANEQSWSLGARVAF